MQGMLRLRSNLQPASDFLDANVRELFAVHAGLNTGVQQFVRTLREVEEFRVLLNPPWLREVKSYMDAWGRLTKDVTESSRMYRQLFDAASLNSIRMVADFVRDMDFVDNQARMVSQMLQSITASQLDYESEEIDEAREIIATLVSDAECKRISLGDLLNRLLGLLDRIPNTHARDIVKSMIGGLLLLIVISVSSCTKELMLSSRSDTVRSARMAVADNLEICGCDSTLSRRIRIVNNHHVRVHCAPRSNAGVAGSVEMGVSIVFVEKRRRWVLVYWRDAYGNERQGWVRSKYLTRIE